MLWQQLVNGLTLGGTYALVALGYTLIFGALDIVNMAHGDIFMWGAFCGLLATMWLHGDVWTALLAGMLGAALIGLVLEYILLRPLRRRTQAFLAPLTGTIGFGIVLQALALRAFGPASQPFPQALKGHTYHLGPLTARTVDLIIVGVGLVLVVSLRYVLARTKLGKAMRATAENPTTARLLGINTDAVVAQTIAIASALGGAAGVLVGLAFAADQAMGLPYGLKGLAVMVIGGMGNMTGALIGGLLLGFVEVLTVQYASSSWQDAAAFAVLFALLIVRPQGLLGRGHAERRA